MLKSICVQSEAERESLLKKFDPDDTTWIVADLAAQDKIREIYLRERKFVQNESCLRARELWETLLFRVRPDLFVISPDMTVALLGEFLDGDESSSAEFPWVQTPGAGSLLYDYISELMPVLSHPEGGTQLTEWLAQRQESAERWGQWFSIAWRAWEFFLQRKLISSTWIPGILVNEVHFEKAWARPLVFDLGAELSSLERDLVTVLARFHPVTIVELSENFNLQSALPRLSFCKYTTMLAEVKDATAQVREWLESGVEPSRIAVVIPSQCGYESVIDGYFSTEGIPLRGKNKSNLLSIPSVSGWLARLRVKMGIVSESDLESCVFSSSRQNPGMSFEEFSRLFHAVDDARDLDRASLVSRNWGPNTSSQKLMSRDEFVTWSSSLWPSEQESWELLEKVGAKIYQECPDLTMKAGRWVNYVSKLVTKLGLTSEILESGVQIHPLSSAAHSEANHVIVLGLTESAMASRSRTSILEFDVKSIEQATGFILANSDCSPSEFALRWLIGDERKQIMLCYPMTDFAGQRLAPALDWLTGSLLSGETETLKIPRRTRWDEIQMQSDLSRIANAGFMAQNKTEDGIRRIEQELGLRPFTDFAGESVKSISASGIEDYLECPFVFAAKRVFRLSDLPSLDLDVDAMTRGNLMHALFAALLEPPVHFDWSEAELKALIERCRLEHKIEIGDERLWAPLCQRYVLLARRFLDFEFKWREKFPNTKTIGRELAIECYLSANGEFCVDKISEPAVLFRGRIDRVDIDAEGHAVVIDYKSSPYNLKHWEHWSKTGQLQLSLYALAIEDGVLAELKSQEVVGAYYYVGKDLSRDTGLHLSEFNSVLSELKPKSKANATGEEKAQLWSEVRGLVAQTLSTIRSGEFAPKPRDPEECEECRWRNLCRAPHLS